MSEPSFHDRMSSLMSIALPSPSTAARVANGIAAEADQRIAELQAKLAEAERERDALRILAERNYPGLKRSGFCSKIHGNDPLPVKCSTCYPTWPALCQEHIKVGDDRVAKEKHRADAAEAKLAAAIKLLKAVVSSDGDYMPIDEIDEFLDKEIT